PDQAQQFGFELRVVAEDEPAAVEGRLARLVDLRRRELRDGGADAVPLEVVRECQAGVAVADEVADAVRLQDRDEALDGLPWIERRVLPLVEAPVEDGPPVRVGVRNAAREGIIAAA